MTEKNISLLKKAIYAVLIAAAVFAAIKYIIPWLLPFIAAFFAAMLLDPIINYLNKTFKIKRGFASAFIVTLFLAMFLILIILLGSEAINAAGSLLHSAPEKLSGISLPIGGVGERIREYIARLPSEISEICSKAFESMNRQAAELPSKLYGKLFSVLSAAAGKTPSIIFFLLMFALSLYFFSAGLSGVKSFIVRQLPLRLRMRIGTVKQDVFSTLKSWTKAQIKLMGITFLELSAAFLILKLNYALLIAAAVSLIDALPVFGIGTVLIPWAIISLLFSDYRRAIFLIAVYAIISLVRSCLEPKLLGSQMGLHPAATLIAIYVGYRVSGVAGMVLFPVALMLLKQFNDRGWIKLWR